MIFRKLDLSEHIKTRKLWEEVFSEDTSTFLDYYYFIKTQDNQIYAAEEDGEICAMIHLNPYRIKIEQKEFKSAYIVAVATKKIFRGRGYMGTLLRKSLEEMYDAKMPFTFLMPAAAEIYTPYDFRYIYFQNIGKIKVEGRGKKAYWSGEEKESNPVLKGVTYSEASFGDADKMSDAYDEYFSGSFQAAAVHDPKYYRTMLLEQQSENGGIRLIKKDGEIKGLYCYAREEGTEIREPLYPEEYEENFLQSVAELCAEIGSVSESETTVEVLACPKRHAKTTRPLIMARIVKMEELFRAICVPEEAEIHCSFAVLDPILRKNSRVWKIVSRRGEKMVHISETEDSEGVIPIAEMTEILFGTAPVAEISKREGVIMPPHLAGELDKIKKLTGTFFNEVV